MYTEETERERDRNENRKKKEIIHFANWPAVRTEQHRLTPPYYKCLEHKRTQTTAHFRTLILCDASGIYSHSYCQWRVGPRESSPQETGRQHAVKRIKKITDRLKVWDYIYVGQFKWIDMSVCVVCVWCNMNTFVPCGLREWAEPVDGICSFYFCSAQLCSCEDGYFWQIVASFFISTFLSSCPVIRPSEGHVVGRKRHIRQGDTAVRRRARGDRNVPF